MISCIHPSYQRPKQAYAVFQAWVKASGPVDDLEWIVALSDGDPYEDEYRELFDTEATVIVVPGRTMVAATNAAAAESTGDPIILVSDDMYPPAKWDELLAATFSWLGDKAAVLQCHDGIRSDILTIPIMNRKAYEMLGYVYHPMYMSMYADNDLRETCEKLGILHIATDIEFDHRHYTVGKADQDMTYKHENSRNAMDHGRRVFERRKARGFPIL